MKHFLKKMLLVKEQENKQGENVLNVVPFNCLNTHLRVENLQTDTGIDYFNRHCMKLILT